MRYKILETSVTFCGYKHTGMFSDFVCTVLWNYKYISEMIVLAASAICWDLLKYFPRK
jgi:hypothetical protein